MTNNVHQFGHVLRSEDGHVLRKAFEYEFVALGGFTLEWGSGH